MTADGETRSEEMVQAALPALDNLSPEELADVVQLRALIISRLVLADKPVDYALEEDFTRMATEKIATFDTHEQARYLLECSRRGAALWAEIALKHIHEARVWQVRHFEYAWEIARAEDDAGIKTRTLCELRAALDQLKRVRELKDWKQELGRDPPALPADVARIYAWHCAVTDDEAEDHGSR